MPPSLTYGDKTNNNYQVRLSDSSDNFRFVPLKVLPHGLEGWVFYRGGSRADASLPNGQLLKLRFKIIHHYKEFRISNDTAARFVMEWLIGRRFFVPFDQGIRQFLFNRKRLARQDRMAILQYMFEQTVEKGDFRTSGHDLPAKIYGMRFYGRDDHDAHLAYYQLVLDSLLHSGDLVHADHSYSISPKAVATLHAFETEEQRHRDNIGTQRKIILVTVVLAILAAAQVGTTVWQELHPDPLTAPLDGVARPATYQTD